MSSNPLDEIKKELGDLLLEAKIERPRRLIILLKREGFKEGFSKLIQLLGIKFISTITGVDLKDKIELIYHLWCEKLGSMVSVRVQVPRDDPRIPTITDLIPGATLYEREVHDMLGVVFEGHPKLERLILPEDWPDGVHPLRKDVPIEKVMELFLKRQGGGG